MFFVPNRGLVPLTVKIAAASAQLDFLLTGGFDDYLFVFRNIVPSVNNEILAMRMSVDGGASFEAGAGSYAGVNHSKDSVAGDDVSSFQNGAANIVLNTGASNAAASGGYNGEVRLFGTRNAAARKFVSYHLLGLHGTAGHRFTVGSSVSNIAALQNAAVNAIRFFMLTGNVTSGSINLLGMRYA